MNRFYRIGIDRLNTALHNESLRSPRKTASPLIFLLHFFALPFFRFLRAFLAAFFPSPSIMSWNRALRPSRPKSLYKFIDGYPTSACLHPGQTIVIQIVPILAVLHRLSELPLKQTPPYISVSPFSLIAKRRRNHGRTSDFSKSSTKTFICFLPTNSPHKHTLTMFGRYIFSIPRLQMHVSKHIPPLCRRAFQPRPIPILAGLLFLSLPLSEGQWTKHPTLRKGLQRIDCVVGAQGLGLRHPQEGIGRRANRQKSPCPWRRTLSVTLPARIGIGRGHKAHDGTRAVTTSCKVPPFTLPLTPFPRGRR